MYPMDFFPLPNPLAICGVSWFILPKLPITCKIVLNGQVFAWGFCEYIGLQAKFSSLLR